MVNHEIVEGLRLALSRGYTLERAMMSFYNAGYKKEEIEEAARALYSHPSQPLSHPHKETPEELKKPIGEVKPATTISEAVDKTEKIEDKKIGKVSTYEEPKTKKRGPLITILLVLLLLILVGGLIGIILYKDFLISYFNTLF
jgi:hypothetical protein